MPSVKQIQGISWIIAKEEGEIYPHWPWVLLKGKFNIDRKHRWTMMFGLYLVYLKNTV